MPAKAKELEAVRTCGIFNPQRNAHQDGLQENLVLRKWRDPALCEARKGLPASSFRTPKGVYPDRLPGQGNTRQDKKALMQDGNILTEGQLLFPFMVRLRSVAGCSKKFSIKWELQKKNLIDLNELREEFWQRKYYK